MPVGMSLFNISYLMHLNAHSLSMFFPFFLVFLIFLIFLVTIPRTHAYIYNIKLTLSLIMVFPSYKFVLKKSSKQAWNMIMTLQSWQAR